MDGTLDAATNTTRSRTSATSGRATSIADRIGMTVELIPHLFRQAVAGARFGMPTNQRGLAYVRHDAGWSTRAFRVLNA
jgi:hypothetical protein